MSIHNPKENKCKEHEVESVKCPYLQGPKTKRKVIKKKGTNAQQGLIPCLAWEKGN